MKGESFLGRKEKVAKLAILIRNSSISWLEGRWKERKRNWFLDMKASLRYAWNIFTYLVTYTCVHFFPSYVLSSRSLICILRSVHRKEHSPFFLLLESSSHLGVPDRRTEPESGAERGTRWGEKDGKERKKESLQWKIEVARIKICGGNFSVPLFHLFFGRKLCIYLLNTMGRGPLR